MMPDECIQIAVSLHGADAALEAFGWMLIRCAAILAAAIVGAAIIRAMGR